ncbi:MAG: hypothetical protein Tsb0014_06190 [Pleurocapsa sp.]
MFLKGKIIFGTVVPKATLIIAYNLVFALIIASNSHTLRNVKDRNFKS